MRHRYYSQAVLSYIVAEIILAIPVWQFDNPIQQMYVGVLSFALAYKVLDKLIRTKKERMRFGDRFMHSTKLSI